MYIYIYVDPESFVHPPVDPYSFVHSLLDPHCFVQRPLDPQSFVHRPLDPHSFVHQPIDPHSFVHPPLDPHSFVHRLLDPHMEAGSISRAQRSCLESYYLFSHESTRKTAAVATWRRVVLKRSHVQPLSRRKHRQQHQKRQAATHNYVKPKRCGQLHTTTLNHDTCAWTQTV